MTKERHIIRSIPMEDTFLADTLIRYPLIHSSLKKTPAGYKDQRFEQFNVHYYRQKNKKYLYELIDAETGMTWNNEVAESLKDCGRMVGSIILKRFK